MNQDIPSKQVYRKREAVGYNVINHWTYESGIVVENTFTDCFSVLYSHALKTKISSIMLKKQSIQICYDTREVKRFIDDLNKYGFSVSFREDGEYTVFDIPLGKYSDNVLYIKAITTLVRYLWHPVSCVVVDNYFQLCDLLEEEGEKIDFIKAFVASHSNPNPYMPSGHWFIDNAHRCVSTDEFFEIISNHHNNVTVNLQKCVTLDHASVVGENSHIKIYKKLLNEK